MNIAVVGTGYVGLVTGTCLAETGNNVICVDIDKKKVDQLRNGQIPIYEPHLDNLFQRNRKLAETGTKLQKGTQIAKRVGYMSSALAATDFVASAPDKENLFVKEENTPEPLLK